MLAAAGRGGLKLIYIDPPFDVGADFSVNLEVGEETLTKEPSVIEELAYRDTWGKGEARPKRLPTANGPLQS